MNIKRIHGELFEAYELEGLRPRDIDPDGEAHGKFNRKKASWVKFILRGEKAIVLKGNKMLSGAELLGMAKLAGVMGAV